MDTRVDSWDKDDGVVTVYGRGSTHRAVVHVLNDFLVFYFVVGMTTINVPENKK